MDTFLRLRAARAPLALAITAAAGAALASPTSAAPEALSFTQPVGSTSRNQVVTVTNNGTAPQVLGPIAVNGPQARDFARDISSSCVGGMTLAAGASCTLAINFTPAEPGARNAALVVPVSAGNPSIVVLTGIGVAPGTQAAQGESPTPP